MTPMKKHPHHLQLARGLSRSVRHSTSWAGEVYRATSVRYANRDDLLTGLGAKSAGGRWNPPSGFATVYTSLTPETALAEYLAQHRYFGWPVSSAMPYVMVALGVTLQKVLDFSDGKVRSSLGVSLVRMIDTAWRRASVHESITQALGRCAFEAELEAILVPSSAALGEVNLVVFPGNLLAPGSWINVINREKLPPPPGMGN
jgi:RES domain-containing protein